MQSEPLAQYKEKYESYKNSGMKLDMSRGKPASDQLDLSGYLLGILEDDKDCVLENGIDCRNYGLPAGIPQIRKLFGEILGVSPKNVIAGGNSSLNMMFDTVSHAYTKCVAACTPWRKIKKVKFLCPVPGYDRHFGVTAYFGIDMINIPMNSDGPDMDIVEKYVENDESVKGIWCVPKYSNPSGITYSDETVRRFAALKPKAKDFRIFWDNSYALHDITDTPDTLLNLYEEALKNKNEDIVFMFTSTSKITFPGGGVACFAASDANIAWALESIAYQTIGPDKLNQLRHAKAFPDFASVRAQMEKHRAIIAPKFKAVIDCFEKNLSGIPGVSWTKPNGGYFISLELPEGCASRVVKMASEAGLVLTPAGATFPYGKDPRDTNIRIAPTYPSVDELEKALDLLVCCIKLSV